MSNPFKAIRLTCFVFLVSLCFALTASAQTQVQESLLYVPVVGQGMGYNIQDLVDIEVSRSGDVITVKRQGKIVFQGSDTTSTWKFMSGKIAITSCPGAHGPALDEISVSGEADTPVRPSLTMHGRYWNCWNEKSASLICCCPSVALGTYRGFDL